ncbi:amino acid adenylation domain-containing protein [Pseudomonas sp. CAU 1711]|uniref:amino acid adenylation domain-containing protein n=1 Tax=Pseudomonas sp. CAU 1711 TaxID=3140356 RepID=UPI0032616112
MNAAAMNIDAQALAERIARLAPEKRAAFIRLLSEKGIELDLLPIVPVPRDAALPLSYAQRRLWFLQQLEPHSGAYNMPAALRLRGPLDVAALRAGLRGLLQRHEVLRSTFLAHPQLEVEQRVGEADPGLPVEDLSAQSEDEREQALRNRIDAEAAAPFDLGIAPLRLRLLRLAQDEHVLLLTAHHIVADAWSLGILTRELAAGYAAALEGRPLELAALPIQYADYAQWQRQCQAQEKELAYWTAQLGGEQPVLELPGDRPRPKQPSGRGGRYQLNLPGDLRDALQRLARAQGTTLFCVLLAAYQVLLYRLSGQTDLRVGVPVAGRTRLETEALIGCFVNTLVLRAELDGPLPFEQLLATVHSTHLDAQAHQQLPFERLVEVLQPQRDLAHAPLFQVLFNLVDGKTSRLPQLPGLVVSEIEREQSAAQFDLSLDAIERQDGLELCFGYSRDLFDEASIARYAAGLQRLLRAIVAEPQRAIGALPLQDDAPQLAECQAQMQLEPWPPLAHLRFAAQAAATPQAPALVLDDQCLSYAELNRRANRIAHHLLGLGLPGEARIGLCLPRGLEMVAAIYGVLKAGLAFVPLDPDYPAERLAHMIEDAGIRLLLVSQATADCQTGSGTPARLDVAAIHGEREDDPAVAVHPAQLAYLMYTSGSTGKPKGVAIEQRALAGHTEVARRFFALTPADRVLQFSTFNFDGFVDQLFPTLTCGACVVLRGPELWDSREFHRRLLRHRISVADLATAYWFQLAQDLALEPQADYGDLRLVSATGEAMPPEGIAAWRQAGLGQVRLLNTYGPTEATVTASVQDCRALLTGEQPLPLQLPIGLPLAGRAFYLLDRDGNLTPPGVPGELCIGGELLARGYHGRPALSAERFVPDPFGPPGARLYRTGDLARRLADGSFEYLGRIDQQVKLRGFRIELGEIEARLQSHPQVRQALALVREDSPGDKRLVAYLVAQGEPPHDDALRAHLKQSLPDYMLPAALVWLDTLPLTPGGKLERKALPAPLYAAEAEVQGPRNAGERLLAEIWCELLQRPALGIHDNFFALGGHSLLATRLVARLRREQGIELPLRALFEAPTIAQLAERLPAAGEPQESIAPVPRDRPLPLSHAQQGLWLVQQLQPDSAAYHIPSVARLRGKLDRSALLGAFQTLTERHEALRTVFVERDGEPLQEILPRVELTLPLFDLRQHPEAERDGEAHRLLIAEATRPFDLRRAPLLRLALVQLGEDEHLLLLVLHHIVADGWSTGILVRELGALYRAALERRPADLPALPIQYADYACWQRQRLDQAALARQLAYWRGQLGEVHEPLELPDARPRPALMSGHGGRQRFRVSAQVAGDLKRLCQERGATLFMGLLGVLQVWVHAHTGRTDPVIGTDVANRGRAETEGVIGFFLNQLALRADLTGNPDFPALLERLRARVLDAYAHQELPFDKLVEALNPRRSLAHAPLFQIKLVLQNQPEDAPDMPGLEVLPEPIEHGQAQLDLHLSIEEDADGLDCTLKYNGDLFDAATVATFAEEWNGLLAAWVAAPAQPVASLAAELAERARLRRLAAQQARSQQGLSRLGGARRKSLLTSSQEVTSP